jgi:endo-1,4-beta-xylanase
MKRMNGIIINVKNILSVWLLAVLFITAANSNVYCQDKSSLKDAFGKKFLIGAAISEFQSSGKDESGIAIVKKQFNTVTSENILKWERVHPKPDVYNFEPTDKYVEFGEKNNMAVMGHTLVWHSQTPRWVFQDADGKPATREVLLERMKDHIQTVVGRYKGRIKGWDVVNEALDEDGSLRKSPWLKIIGEDFIEKAFQFAHEADPDAELYYNDYSLENEPKLKGAIAIVKNLQAKGIKVSAVGTQGHYLLNDPSPAKIENCIKEIAATGLPIMFTELDVNVLPTPFDNTTAEVSLKAEYQEKYNPYVKGMPDSVEQKYNKYYQDIFAVFVKNQKDIKRITFWGVTDKTSWLNNWPIFGRTNYPLLFDRKGEPKPAFEAVLKTAE